MRRFIFGVLAAALLVPAVLPLTGADSCPAKTYVYSHNKLAGQRIPVHAYSCVAQDTAGVNVEQIDTAFITPGADVFHVVHSATTVGGPATLTAVVTGFGYNGLTLTLTPRTCCLYQSPDVDIDPLSTVDGGTLTVEIRDGATVIDTVVYHSAL